MGRHQADCLLHTGGQSGQSAELSLVMVLSQGGPGVEVVLPVVPQGLAVEAVLAVLLSAGRTAVDCRPAAGWSTLIGRKLSRLYSDWLDHDQLSHVIKTQLKAPIGRSVSLWPIIDPFRAWKPANQRTVSPYF